MIGSVQIQVGSFVVYVFGCVFLCGSLQNHDQVHSLYIYLKIRCIIYKLLLKTMNYSSKSNCSSQPNHLNLTHSKPLRSDSTDDEFQIDYRTPRVVKTNICKYKTEMCKNFSENGFCPYTEKCQFAHGYHQLSYIPPAPKKAYRTRKCKSFWEEGVCRYGLRCQFSHYEEKNSKSEQFLAMMKNMICPQVPESQNKLLRILEKTIQ